MLYPNYRKLCKFLALSLPLASSLQAALLCGPMLGPLEMREAKVWIQAENPSVVRVAYIDQASSKQHYSTPVETNPALGNTATVTLDGVEPGKTYDYQVELNGTLLPERYSFQTPVFFKDRTPPPTLRVAVGGAHYVVEDAFEPPYTILGGGYGIFSTILQNEPDMMIWAGNTAHIRESDWASQSGYIKRYSKARSVPELKNLIAQVPQYAVWSSSDYGIGNAGRYASTRAQAEASFEAFWPKPVEITSLEGVATRFRRADVDFFMIDVRSYRDDIPPPGDLPLILGDKQIEWLRQELIRSTATFKIIIAGAPILNPADSAVNLSYADGEHTKLLQMLRDERISGLFFISGGKYYGELTRLVHANSYNLHDLTIGPLTANPTEESDELNFFRMPGTTTTERHFALLDFTGPEADREITVRVLSMEGKELWNRSVKASQLQPVE
ncbi:MAG: alkaline phosphatase D family protein [Verrucomicrobiota bacterium]